MANDSTLYLNGVFLTKTKGYMKAETRGRYLLLMTALPSNWSICAQLGILKEREIIDVTLGRAQNNRSGISGKEIGGSMPVFKGLPQHPIVYDMQTGVAEGFSMDCINKFLKKYPALREKYGGTSAQDMSTQEQIAFVNEVNRAYEQQVQTQ